jgi:hypothetical protein
MPKTKKAGNIYSQLKLNLEVKMRIANRITRLWRNKIVFLKNILNVKARIGKRTFCNKLALCKKTPHESIIIAFI